MLPPIFYHYFQVPLPYVRALALQERLLLLLQHRPVYTAGRRLTEQSLTDDRTRLTAIGADFCTTERGGELTYHGPGQIVGYPLLDLRRWTPVMGTRDYVCRLQKMMEGHLLHVHGIKTVPSEHTGVFLNQSTKIGSIGVQVRHRLTSHGFAFNVTREPLDWFNRIVACGLADVKAGSIETTLNRSVDLQAEIPHLVQQFGIQFQRQLIPLNLDDAGEIADEILSVE